MLQQKLEAFADRLSEAKDAASAADSESERVREAAGVAAAEHDAECAALRGSLTQLGARLAEEEEKAKWRFRLLAALQGGDSSADWIQMESVIDSDGDHGPAGMLKETIVPGSVPCSRGDSGGDQGDEHANETEDGDGDDGDGADDGDALGFESFAIGVSDWIGSMVTTVVGDDEQENPDRDEDEDRTGAYVSRTTPPGPRQDTGPGVDLQTDSVGKRVENDDGDGDPTPTPSPLIRSPSDGGPAGRGRMIRQRAAADRTPHHRAMLGAGARS